MTAHMSGSQLSDLLTCGWRFYLQRQLLAPRRPYVAAIGGTTFHKITELLDTGGEFDIDRQWALEWDRAVEAEAARTTYPYEQWTVSGRASKAWPAREDAAWWAEHGPDFVRTWQRFRADTDMRIVDVEREACRAVPGVELPVTSGRGTGVELIGTIDRLVTLPDQPGFGIVDLKTGARTEAWPRQLILHNVGLHADYGIRASWGAFWSARKGGFTDIHDLTVYDDAEAWEWVRRAAAIRDQGLFLPQPSPLCGTCAVRDFCSAVQGSDVLSFAQHASITPSEER